MGGMTRVVVWCLALPALAGCVGAPVGYPGYGGVYGGAYPPGAPVAAGYGAERYATVNDPAPARTQARAASRARPRAVTPVVAGSPYDAKQPDGQATPAVAAAPECRTVTELTYVDGQEVRQAQRYCRTPPSREWVKS